MADAQQLKLSGIQAVLEQATAYKEMLEREAAAKAAVEEQHAAEEQQVGAQIGALVEAAFLVAAADQRYTNEEAQRLVHIVGALTHNKFSEEQLHQMAEAASLKLGEGLAARAEAVASLLGDEELRHSALLVASAVAYQGGGVGQKEGLALQQLARSFGFSIDQLHKIMGQAARG